MSKELTEYIALINSMKFLKTKEKRYLIYRAECIDKGIRATVGDVCKALHTTPHTLLGKTEPALQRMGLL